MELFSPHKFETKKCEYCERPVRNLTKDHIIPISKGGDNIVYNITYVCFECNNLKDNIMPFVFIDQLKLTIKKNISLGGFSLEELLKISNNLLSILRERGFYRYNYISLLTPIQRKKFYKPRKRRLEKQPIDYNRKMTDRQRFERNLRQGIKVLAGHLIKEVGHTPDYEPLVEGHPVYEYDEYRYVIFATKKTPITHDIFETVQIRYYKTTLKDYIQLIDKQVIV